MYFKERCSQCRTGTQKDCLPLPLDQWRAKTARAKCLTCRSRQVGCAWGLNIPPCLQPVKLAILQRHDSPTFSVHEHNSPPRPGTSSEQDPTVMLEELKAMTECALSEVYTLLHELLQVEMDAVLEGLNKIRS